MLPQRNHSRALVAGSFLFAGSILNRNSKGAQKTDILSRKWLVPFLAGFGRETGSLQRLVFHFVQADGCLEHQQDVKSMLSDVLYYPRNLWRLGDRFMDSFAQLLDQTLKFLVQGHPRFVIRSLCRTRYDFSDQAQILKQRDGSRRPSDSITLLLMFERSKLNPRALLNF